MKLSKSAHDEMSELTPFICSQQPLSPLHQVTNLDLLEFNMPKHKDGKRVSIAVAKATDLNESERKSRANTRLYEHPRPSDLSTYSTHQAGKKLFKKLFIDFIR